MQDTSQPMDPETKIQVLLAEYREAMESQRSNTTITYSWMGSILLVLSTGLFFYGIQLDDFDVFVPVMLLAMVLVMVWWGLTETFVFYIGQRLRRIHEIEQELGMRLMSQAGQEIKNLGWRARFVEARTYVRLFGGVYILICITLIILWIVKLCC